MASDSPEQPLHNTSLCLQGFGLAFGSRVILAECDLALAPTGIDVLMGPVKTGKSSLLRSLAGQFDDLKVLHRGGKTVCGVHPLQERPCALCILGNPVDQARRDLDGVIGQQQPQWHRILRAASEVQRRWHEKQRAFGRSRGAHRMDTPAARSMWQVRISGSPTSAVGSSLSIASSRLMPKPSLLALPAQS